jgi:hypothetical protein
MLYACPEAHRNTSGNLRLDKAWLFQFTNIRGDAIRKFKERNQELRFIVIRTMGELPNQFYAYCRDNLTDLAIKRSVTLFIIASTL